MADAETPSPEKPPSHLPRRKWIPTVALALAAVVMIALQWLPLNGMAEGDRRGLSFIVAALAFVAVAAWFFFGSGVSRRARAIGAVLLAGTALFVVFSVRRVEFSGDMVPTFDFRWTAERHELLEEHRAHQPTADELPPISLEVEPGDVLEYRGPHRDGIEPGPALARDWSTEPPRPVWRQPVGGGYASFVVVGPTLVTIEQRRDKEAIVAYDADSGIERWVYEYPALFHETLGGDGPRATPTFYDGKLYSLGATGVLSCVDFVTGKPLWSFNILLENECANLDWAMSGSPLVYDRVVLVNPGNQKGGASSRSIVAYDLVDGKRRWGGGASKASYASPMLVELGGRRQLLIFDAAGVAGYGAVDGRELWRFGWESDFDINAAQPVIVDADHVLISSASGAALLKIGQADDAWTADEVWRTRRMKCGYSSPIAYDGHLYGIDENILACVDLSTGKQLWKNRKGQFGHGQILLRDDLLLVLGEAGELALVEATPEQYNELGRIQAIEGKTWNVPLLVGNRIYVRNHLEMAAYDLPVDEKDGEEQDDEENRLAPGPPGRASEPLDP